LRETSDQNHAHHNADERTDHTEPALAQRRTIERGLTDDRRRGAGPKQIVEFESDIERETHRSPQPQAEG
jgi:hypothetical protein